MAQAAVRRPLALLGAAVFLAAVAAPLPDPRVTGILAAVCGGLGLCALLLAVLQKLHRRTIPAPKVLATAACALLCVSLLFLLFVLRWNSTAAPVQSLDGATTPVSMEILDYPDQRYGRCYYRANVLEIDGQPVDPFTVRFSCPEPLYCQPCDRVQCQATFYRFRSGGPFSTFSAQLADGNVLGAYQQGYDALCIPNPEDFPQGRILPLLRQMLTRNLSRSLPDQEAGLLQTVLLGYSLNLPNSVYSNFRQLGCSHMLAISGLHLSLVAGFISLALARMPGPRRVKNFFCGILLFGYLVMTGFPVSAIRSYVMYFLYLVADSIGSKPDSLNSLGAAVLVICFTNPFSGGDVGFVLSVLATAGIVLFHRPLSRALTAPLRRYPVLALALRPAVSIVAVTLSATAATLPVQVLLFGGLPLIAPPANLLLLPPFTLLLYCSLPLLLLTLYPPGTALAQPFILVCGVLARTVLWLAEKLAALPGIFLSLDQPGWTVCLVFCLLAALLLLTAKGGRAFRRRRFMSVALMISALCVPPAWSLYTRDAVTIAVCGDSQSACVVVMQNGSAAVLSMGGFNSGKARQILSSQNIRGLESVLVNGQGYQAKRMAQELLSSNRPNRLYMLEGSYAGKDLARPGVPVEFLEADSVYQALPGLTVEVSGSGARLGFTANGTRVLVDLGDESPAACNLLITTGAAPQVQAGLTLLVCDEGTTPEDASKVVPSDFILADAQAVAYITLEPGGTVGLASQN